MSEVLLQLNYHLSCLHCDEAVFFTKLVLLLKWYIICIALKDCDFGKAEDIKKFTISALGSNHQTFQRAMNGLLPTIPYFILAWNCQRIFLRLDGHHFECRWCTSTYVPYSPFILDIFIVSLTIFADRQMNWYSFDWFGSHMAKNTQICQKHDFEHIRDLNSFSIRKDKIKTAKVPLKLLIRVWKLADTVHLVTSW